MVTLFHKPTTRTPDHPLPVAKGALDQITTFDREQQTLEQKILRSILAVQSVLQDAALDQAVIDAIGRRDLNGALRLVGLGTGNTAEDAVRRFLPVFETARVGLVDAGHAFAVHIPGRLDDGSLGRPLEAAGQTRLQFNPVGDKAVRAQQEMRNRVLQGLFATHAATATFVIADGMTRQEDPIVTARRLKASIPLTEQQARSVRSFEAGLRAGDPSVLRRTTRDRRFDATIRRAIAGETVLSDEQIRRMTDRMTERLKQFRARTIAQTESTLTASTANQLVWQQAVDEGFFNPDEVRRFWQPLDDGRVREAHVAIPKLNPEGVSENEPFVSPLGPIFFPGDPRAPAANVVNCRCRLFFRLRGDNEPLPETPDLPEGSEI